ncbi:hypothetical protein [Streptomyces sp. NPDC095817]|uniref:hypothetical protein n=1 Tax=Streptomyces sp. NPDC095817 TaxID=3155082 RepID=UPI0033232290
MSTDHTLHAPPAVEPQTPRPYANNPRQWQTERSRALRIGHRRNRACSPGCPHVLINERTRWGWLTWAAPTDGTLPAVPHLISVLDPTATRIQRQAVLWLTRRPARRVALHPRTRGNARLGAFAVTLASLAAALLLLVHGAPWDVILPAVLLAPMLADRLPGYLDARAWQHVRTVHGDAAVHYLQRLTALQTVLTRAATRTDRHELLRPAEIGQHVLWDAAGLLQDQDTRSASAALIARERLMVQLADQVTSALTRLSGPTAPGQHRTSVSPLGPYPPAPCPSIERGRQAAAHATSTEKGSPLMPQSDDTAHGETDVFLLFAHEPYYPDNGPQEINTTVVSAATLLHPQVKQPDGARIHALLTHGRRPGTVVPLSTLTHELGGGANWPQVGDFERVTQDVLLLVQQQRCDALSLGLPSLERALVCIGPGTHQEVRIFDSTTGDSITHGQADRAAVLDEVQGILTAIKPERPLWPGDHLLPPLSECA